MAVDTPGPTFGACAVPHAPGAAIELAHGSGGRLSRRLLDDVILPTLGLDATAGHDDAALLAPGARQLAFTTDAYVVTPLFFPGGDIGALAVYGTVNDLATRGARPRWLSISLILEEGLLLATLVRVLESMRVAAERCGVCIVTGDTKVVGRGAADQIFVTTAGIGEISHDLDLGASRVQPGDAVLVSGTVGDHGMAILAERNQLGISGLASDTGPVHELAEALIQSGVALRCMRDPTRGGVAAALSEVARASRVGLELTEAAVPLRDEVRGACELLGIDPLLAANEGKLLAFVAGSDAERALLALRAHPLGAGAALIARATATPAGEVTVRTVIGGRRALDLPMGDVLPRIC